MRVPPEARPPGTYTGPDRDELVRRLELTDGGLYDNMGLEPVWRDHEVVLVSDASPSFKYAPSVFGLAWGGLRYAVTLLEQATDVRKRWLISSFLRGDLTGTYWGIGSLPGHYGYASDAFSEGEICVLENHGYLLAEIALRTHASELVAGPWPEPRVPHPDWMDESRARRALAESAQTKLFARYR